MSVFRGMRVRAAAAGCALAAAGVLTFGFQQPAPSRFDRLVVADPSALVSPQAAAAESLPAGGASLAAGWKSFRASHGDQWKILVDGRSGAPLMVEGQGIPWIAGSGNSLREAAPPTTAALAASLRGWLGANRTLFAGAADELSLNTEASGLVANDLWQIQFNHVVAGVPVVGDRYVFYIGHGNLMAFGAPRWAAVLASTVPALTAEEAMARLRSYMGLESLEPVEVREPGTLELLPVPAAGSTSESYSGPVGGGYETVLIWRVALSLPGDAATWVGYVDAKTGSVIAFFDETKYAQVKGGVYPASNDQICPDGCEQPNFPLPYANVTINGSPVGSNSLGTFSCSPVGGTATTTLAGTYVRVSDSCGAISISGTCDTDLDLKTSTGTDCTVPAGTSAGDTHAARTSFYHLNRIKEHARAWLPGNGWLNQQLTDNVNIVNSCNAFWNSGGASGTVNFYRSSSSCRNTGEIDGVFLHEWGHGLDQNDGGNYDNPSEAYGDITSFLVTHTSCIGRGFLKTSMCSGYGNACLSCNGVRDVDWNARAEHTPSTPTGFLATHCSPAGTGQSNGPCGREQHCESYVSTEAVWDFAVRDLTAAGIDQNTAWEIADRLWYVSRTGSGGNAYSCPSLATSDGCLATSWFSKMRVVDDDDGNLANGTPHAAALFGAFNRHKIACGAAGDASNQNSSTCPVLSPTVLTSSGGPASASLSWTASAGAASYRVLRNDLGCSSGFTIVGTTAGTSFTDTSLAPGFVEYYAVQPVGSNASCAAAVSNCTPVTPGSASTADLSVTVSDSPDPAPAGGPLAYTITISNGGPGPAAAPQLATSTGTRATFLSMSAPGWTCTTPAVGATGPVTCTGPSLAASASAVLTLTVTVKPCVGDGTTISHTSTVSSSTTDPTMGNNTGMASTTVSDPGTCNDGNACTQTDTCVAGSCVGGNPVVCTASDTCHSTGTCAPATGVCSNPPKPDGSACDDANACTQTDACSSGACVGGNPVVCSALDDCHVAGACQPADGTCSAGAAKPDGSGCNDGNPCTVGDACAAGSCSGAPAPPPGDVNDSVLVSQSAGTTSIAWSDGPGPFNVYRGSVTGPWSYNHGCFAPSVSSPVSDGDSPGVDAAFYYLVSRKDACGESAAGRNSLGAADPTGTPCP